MNERGRSGANLATGTGALEAMLLGNLYWTLSVVIIVWCYNVICYHKSMRREVRLR